MTNVEFDTEIDGLEVLEEDECRQMLALERVGRVAVSIGALPAVFPVNYTVAGDEIFFFTGEGTKLRAATRNAVVAFEVDHIDQWNKVGWSVMVLGTAREVMEPVVVAGARASGLHPWADGERSHLVSLSVELLSGRRVLPSGHGAEAPSPAPPPLVLGPHTPVSALAHRPVRVAPGATLQDAADVMRQANVSSVLVDPDTAIVTERDLARALQAGLGPEADVSGSVSATWWGSTRRPRSSTRPGRCSITRSVISSCAAIAAGSSAWCRFATSSRSFSTPWTPPCGPSCAATCRPARIGCDLID